MVYQSMSLFQACSNRFRALFEQQAKSSRHLSPRSEGCFVRKCLTMVIEFVIPVIVPAAVSACNLINSHTLTPTEFGSGSNSFLKFVLSENRKHTYVKDLLKVKLVQLSPTWSSMVQPQDAGMEQRGISILFWNYAACQKLRSTRFVTGLADDSSK